MSFELSSHASENPHAQPHEAILILSRPRCIHFLALFLWLCVASSGQARADDSPSVRPPATGASPRLAFVGLHGGVFEAFQQFEEQLDLRLDYIADAQIAREQVDLADYQVVLLQHTREEHRDEYRRLITSAQERNPQLRIISISGLAENDLPELAKRGAIEHDATLKAYYGTSSENLRRFLIYISVHYLGRPGDAPPPEEVDEAVGLFHPDHRGMFPSVGDFLDWARKQGKQVENVPRACIAVHAAHLAFQQPEVVAALIRGFEKQGILAVAMIDYGPDYERDILEFEPTVVVHTCHSREQVPFRERLGAPHLHSIFFRDQSIEQWQAGIDSLNSGELAFQVIGQELLGAIEPQVGAGTIQGGGSEEAFVPIPERIDHLVSRASAWARLATTAENEKRVAFIYYDREMGKGELMRGSATGMFMNGPRSLVNVLGRMKQAGYNIGPVPTTEDELLGWMMERGRQIGVWNPGILEQLARSGEAVLVPVSQYEEWFNRHVPEPQRKEVIDRWGPPPGKFLVWEHGGEQSIVIPRIDLGNVTLLPQPLRGEAHDTSLVHDLRVPPPHNYLATYFWLQEEFQADAMVHFGTHGSEFMLPGKPAGLSEQDWPDIVLGNIPNINPWVLNNLGESSPARRRAYAVLIDHLVPPSVNAELSDELLNLHNDIDKWIVLAEGRLKEKFRESITRQVREARLIPDLHIDLAEHGLLSADQIQKVLSYLHEIHNETTPINLHVLGEPPREDLLIPYLVTCLRSAFVDQLNTVIEVPPEESLTAGDRDKYLRKQGEEILTLVIRRGLSPEEAIAAIGGTVSVDGLGEELRKSFELADRLAEGFAQAPQEVDQLLAALDGRFIAPGSGNSPDRNPASLPTGRNMYVMNPEEVPARPSWELGRQLVDQLLNAQFERHGRYPGKIGFTLNSFATFQDYGVMESQILYLLGVRPVWDQRNVVTGVELIPAAELGRPRIDVFIAGHSYYRDMLPTRMRLIDKAVRLVAETDEDEEMNFVRRNSREAEEELKQQGLPAEKAAMLSRARIFGYPSGQTGSAGYYYLVERSGEWDSREELVDSYLAHVRNVYTEGAWGEPAEEAYNRHIQGTEAVLRSWSDRTRSPLSNKYVWYHGGSLCLAVKHLTGKQPEFLLSDVRDPDAAVMVGAEDALRKDFRVRLFNRKWIEGMMREGYAGADQVATHVSNTMGWEIMRPESVSDDLWEEIVEIYIRDRKNLAIQEWFEAENPYAYQDLTEILLETIRKGYWQPGSETTHEIVREYARSVARHGEGGGLRGGGNVKLEEFVRELLQAPGDEEGDELLAAYEARAAESSTVDAEADPAPHESPAAPQVRQQAQPDRVEGRKMVSAADTTRPHDDQRVVGHIARWLLGLAAGCLAVLLAGYGLKWGVPGR